MTVAPPKSDSGVHLASSSGAGSSGAGGSSGGGESSSGNGFGADDASSADDGGPDDTSTSSDSGVAGDTGVADTAVAATEGGIAPASTCQAPTGGAACNPGLVTCGSTSCATSSSFCCEDDDGGGACAAYNSAGCSNGDLTLQCDETADCTSGVCCEEVIALGVAGPTQCMSSCPSGWFQICKSNTECGTGDGGGVNRCVLQTCTQPPGLLTEGSSVVVEACAVPPGLVTIGFGTSGPSGALAGCVAQ